jgi:hypothetical protein
MRSSYMKLVVALSLVAIGLAIAAGGIYIGDTDDAPGAALMGILAALGMLALAVRIALRKSEHR